MALLGLARNARVVRRMWSWIVRFVSAGTERHADPRRARHALVTNALAMTYCALLAPYIGVYFLLGLPVPAIALAVVIASYIVAIRVNRLGTPRALDVARALFMTSFTAGVVVFSGFLGHGTGVHLLSYVGACIPFVFCDTKERKLIGYGVLVALAGNLMVEFGRDEIFGPAIMAPATQRVMYASLIPATFASMLAAVFHFVRVSDRAEQALGRNLDDLRRILDTVDQGLVTIGPSGEIRGGRSATLERWFGVPSAGQPLWTYLGRESPRFAAHLAACWEQIESGFLPLELCIDQLPRRFEAGGRAFELEFKPIVHDHGAMQMLVVVTDITDELAHAHSEMLVRELALVAERLLQSRGPFLDFVEESSRHVERILDPSTDSAVALRVVHTLKGNCGAMGIDSVMRVCHDVESRAAAQGGQLRDEDRALVAAAWASLAEPVHGLLGHASDRVDVALADYEAMRAAVKGGASMAELSALLDGWTLDTGVEHIEQLAAHGRAVANQLGKPLHVELDADGTRFARLQWAPLWSALVHVIRNSIDHGLEPADARVAQGKPREGALRLEVCTDETDTIVRISDDGRGIDWPAVRRRAEAMGLPHGTRADLEAALFADGLSTRQEITSTSGRGVGMAAVRDACAALHGVIEIESQAGRGTRFSFRFPVAKSGSTVATMLRAAS
jgi:signal transduction histidine kinase